MRDGEREVLDAAALAGVRPAALALGTLYLVFSASHVLLLPPAAARVMAPLTLLQAGLLLGLAYLLGRRPFAPRQSHPLLGAVGLVAFSNSGALLALLGEPQQVTNLYFLAVGAGFLLLDRRWLAAYLALLVACFGLAVLRFPGGGWTHYGFGMLSATALAVVIHHVRVRTTLGLERSRREAAEAAERLRSVMAAAPVVLFAIDAAGRITLCEGQGLRRLGLAPGEAVGRDVHDMYSHNPHLLAQVREAVSGGAARTTVEEGGAVFEVCWSQDASGGVVGVATDVTDRRRAEEERERAARALDEVRLLKEQDAFKTQFLNNAAHELGTPMTPIRLQLHLLETEADPEVRARALAVLRRNFDRLGRIVADLLTSTRLQRGDLELRKEAVDLCALARSAVESFAQTAARAGIDLRLEAPGGVTAFADPSRLHQVLDNLLANALKFTAAGGTVEVRVRRSGEGAQVTVRDSGVGIAPEDQRLLFQPFTQLAEGKARGGTGLGLHICKSLVELHGGRIACRSDGPGTGAEFTFTVPRP
ncbi:MAG TPA: ATP-binding protein [Candidatus Thermoplasmatota archaeon]|nr:ATP-binding protein [Candidatus Thermoplasmatota archaeon]